LFSLFNDAGRISSYETSKENFQNHYEERGAVFNSIVAGEVTNYGYEERGHGKIET
jgi:hypothetical protein